MTETLEPVSSGDWMAAVEAARIKAARHDPDVEARREAFAAQADRQRWLDAWPRQVPSRFDTAELSQLDGEAAELADDWTSEPSRNVLLLGGVGVGKTHAAVAMARQAYATLGWSVLFAPAVELLDDLRPGGPEQTMDRACAVDVLVLDDLGSERPTDWTGERMYRLVNRRWLEQRPTIVTANQTADDLERAVGARMFSRLWHGALAVELAGADRRRSTTSSVPCSPAGPAE